MNDILKQRLIGALILLALGVVFWPIIFVQPEQKDAQPRAFPPPPAVSTEPLDAPDETGLRTSPEIAAETEAEAGDAETALIDNDNGDGIAGAVPAPQAQPAPQPTTAPPKTPQVAHGTTAAAAQSGGAATAARSEAPQPLKTDANGVPQAWALQVATVSSAEKAEDLRQRLLAMQQTAYITTVYSGGNKLYRVSVGPKFERAELAAAQARINAAFGVSTMIVRYTP